VTTRSHRLRIVLAGGGVAGVELALALRHLAGDLVELTIISPDPEFHLQALGTAQPFCAYHIRGRPLCDLADTVNAELILDSVIAVDAEHRSALLAGGELVDYDCLVLAVGARHRTPFARALTFAGDRSA